MATFGKGFKPKLIKELYALEGDHPHHIAHEKNITMSGGVVPDQIEYNGVKLLKDEFEINKYGKLDTSKINMASIMKEGISSSNYDNYDDFFADVVPAYIKNNRVDKYFNSKMGEGYNVWLAAAAWNSPSLLGYDGFGAAMKEASNYKPHQWDYSKIAAPAQYAIAGGQYMPGLVTRRLKELNILTQSVGGKKFNKFTQEKDSDDFYTIRVYADDKEVFSHKMTRHIYNEDKAGGKRTIYID